MFENFLVPQYLKPTDPRFGVGPSLVPLKSLEALRDTGHHLLGTSHRKDAVRNVVREIQTGISTYFQIPSGYEIVLGNGGATLFWDMLALGVVRKSSLHFVCGEFSEKWYKAHKSVPWISAHEIRVPFGKGINPVEQSDADLICCTLNETSTGVMLSNVPKLNGEDVLMAMDATSGAGQIKVDFNNVDIYYFSPQKVFASEGGLYVAILSPKALKRIESINQDKSRYIPESLRLIHAVENGKANQTYNTPAISTLFLMNEQLKLMNQLGQDTVIKMAKEKARFMYDWAEEKPYLSPYISEKEFRSEAVITIDVDEKYSVDDLAKVMRAQDVAIDIEGYRKLGRNQFRIALFHNVTLDNLKKLTQIISLAIEAEK
jgi:phosphoserine aminotransferase